MKIHTIHDEDLYKIETEIRLELLYCRCLSDSIKDENMHELIEVWFYISRKKLECIEKLLKCIVIYTTRNKVEIDGKDYGFIEHNNRLHDLEFIFNQIPKVVKEELQEIYDSLKDDYLQRNPEIIAEFQNRDLCDIEKLIVRVSQMIIDNKYFGFVTYRKNKRTGQFERQFATPGKNIYHSLAMDNLLNTLMLFMNNKIIPNLNIPTNSNVQGKPLDMTKLDPKFRKHLQKYSPELLK